MSMEWVCKKSFATAAEWYDKALDYMKTLAEYGIYKEGKSQNVKVKSEGQKYKPMSFGTLFVFE